MFMKNRSFNVKMVKDNPDGPQAIFESPDPFLGPQVIGAYAEVVKDVVTHTALTVGGVYTACQIIKRICK